MNYLDRFDPAMQEQDEGVAVNAEGVGISSVTPLPQSGGIETVSDFQEQGVSDSSPRVAAVQSNQSLPAGNDSQFLDAYDPSIKEREVADYEAEGGGILSSLERGARRIDQSFAASRAFFAGDAPEGDDLSDAELFRKDLIDRDRQKVIDQGKAIQELPQHPTMRRAVGAANKEEGYLDAAGAFIGEVVDSPDTSGFLIDQAAELVPQVISFFVGTKGVDKLLPAAMQGIARKSASMGGGGFASSVASTYGPNVSEALDKGLKYDQAEARAALQSLSQGGVDALTSAVIPFKIGPNQFTNIPAQTMLQMIGGASGEIARSTVAGEKAEKGDVVAEALLEALGLPGEAMTAMTVKGKEQGKTETPVGVTGARVSEGNTESSIDDLATEFDQLSEQAGQEEIPGSGQVQENPAQPPQSAQPTDEQTSDVIPAVQDGVDVGTSIESSSFRESGSQFNEPVTRALKEIEQGAGIGGMSSQDIQEVLSNPESDIQDKTRAIYRIEATIAEKDAQAAQEWLSYATQALQSNQPVLPSVEPLGATQGGIEGVAVSSDERNDDLLGSGLKNQEPKNLIKLNNDLEKNTTDESTLGQGIQGEADPGNPTKPNIEKSASGLNNAINQAAHEAATSPENDLKMPTDKQKEAGNYKTGKLKINNLDLSVENPAGSTRSGEDSKGRPWSTKLKDHYGYFSGTIGKDKDPVDVFVNTQDDSDVEGNPVFVIDQSNADGSFDEAKVVLGGKNAFHAKAIYRRNYEKGWKGGGDVTRFEWDEFKQWIKNPTETQKRAADNTIVKAKANDGAGSYEFTEKGDYVFVKGDITSIRKKLDQANVQTRGIASKKRGGITFNRKHEAEIRAVLDNNQSSVSDDMPASGANSFAPGASYVGMVDDAKSTSKPTPADKPIRREEILVPFLKALKVPLYQGRVKGKGKLGFYLPKREAVRIKKKNDLEVAAHELAHLIDDRVPEISQAWKKNTQLREELRSISYDKNKIYEGYAEAVRLWMTQPEKLEQVAPIANAWLNEFAQRHEYGPAMMQAREGMTDWFAQSALNRAQSKIGRYTPINESLNTFADTFRQSVSDDFDGIYRMERGLTGTISPHGPYETARLTRGAYSVVEGALTIGAPVVNDDGTYAFKGKGLEKILDPVADDLDGFVRYAVGRSANELMAQKREHLFTQPEIDAMLRSPKPEYKKAFNEYQAWNKKVVDFAERLGIINPETRKLWKRAQYLPFYRVSSDQRQTADSGVDGDWRGIQRLTGGTDNLSDILQNMVQNASQLIVAALRNEARVQVADFANKVKGGGRFMVKIPKEAHPTKINKDEIKRIINQAGIVPEDVTADFSKLSDLVSVFQFGQAPKGKNVVAVMRKGKPEFYEVADTILMRSMSAFERPTKPWVTRFLGGFKRVGQSSITLTMDFMAANIARDTLMGGVISKHGFKPFMDSARGMKSRISKDQDYQDFIANGGGFSSIYLDDTAFKKKLDRFYSKKGIDTKTLVNSPLKLLYFVETLGDAVEMSTRLGEFKRARAAGSDLRHAAYSAREVSTDFAMRGDSEVLGFFYDTVMFLKAGVNGMDRLYRGFSHDDNRLHIAARTGLLASVSMALYAINRDNELYDELEDWDKDTNWHFFIPKTGTHAGTPLEERYHHFRYPKLWEVGAISSIAERAVEGILEGKPKKFGLDFIRVLMDQFKLDYVPQAIRPMYEQYLNKNRFTGAPIETRDIASLSPFARAKPHTASVMKDLGMATRKFPRELQVSPVRTEALLRGYLNTWALYGLSLLDGALYDDKPDMRVDQYPVFRRFYAAEPAKRTKYETQFYDMLKEATELRRTMHHMVKIEHPDIANDISNNPKIGEYDALTKANKGVRALKNEMKKVTIDKSILPSEKRRQLDALTQQKNDFLENIVTNIESNRKE